MARKEPQLSDVPKLVASYKEKLEKLADSLQISIAKFKAQYDSGQNALENLDPQALGFIVQLLENFAENVANTSSQIKRIASINNALKETSKEAGQVFGMIKALAGFNAGNPQTAEEIAKNLDKVYSHYTPENKSIKKKAGKIISGLRAVPNIARKTQKRDEDINLTVQKALSKVEVKTLNIKFLIKTYNAQTLLNKDLEELKNYITGFKTKEKDVLNKKKELSKAFEETKNILASKYLNELQGLISENGELRTLLSTLASSETILTKEQAEQVSNIIKPTFDKMYTAAGVAFKQLIVTYKALAGYMISLSISIKDFDDNALDKILEDLTNNIKSYTENATNALEIFKKEETLKNIVAVLNDVKNIKNDDANSITKDGKKSFGVGLGDGFTTVFNEEKFKDLSSVIKNILAFSVIIGVETKLRTVDIVKELKQQAGELTKFCPGVSEDDVDKWPLHESFDGMHEAYTADGKTDDDKRAALSKFKEEAEKLHGVLNIINKKLFDSKAIKKIERELAGYKRDALESFSDINALTAEISRLVDDLKKVIPNSVPTSGSPPNPKT